MAGGAIRRELQPTGVPGLVKRARSEVSGRIVSVQSPLPVQSPNQPANAECVAGVAVSVTCSPTWPEMSQGLDSSQLIPAGEATFPVPLPVRSKVGE